MKPLLNSLQQRQVYLGTSSWKYPGWKGLVYHREYRSQKEFNEKCLEEYATLYPTVNLDHTYYDWPNRGTFEKYVAQVPPSFRFGLKVTDRITVTAYPNIRRYGKLAGTQNPDFLNPTTFEEKFLGPLEPFQPWLGPVILEFSRFKQGTIASGREFLERLDHFLAKLRRREGLLLGVEIRNQSWLRPEYFTLLAKHGVAHVFNSWTWMPPVLEQLERAAAFPQPFLVARLLLQPGTSYEESVEAFSPYDRVQEEQPQLRQAAAQLIRLAISRKVPAYIFVNNRAEGCAPKTIEGIVERLFDRDKLDL